MGVAYDRRYELTLARPLTSQFFGFQPNATIVRGLEVKFQVARDLESKPNTADIQVYNLAEAARQELQKKPLHVILAVGYASDASLTKLIEGDLMFAATKHTGSDVITTFTIGDGERSFVESRVKVSFGGGVNVKTAVVAIADSMGLQLPKSASELPGMLKQFGSGLSLRGASRDAMDKVLRGTGMGWSMQDGQLQVLAENGTRPGSVELISVRTGLIDSPEYSPAKEPSKPAVLKFKVQLRPQLIPGGRVKIESAEVNGVFRLIKVTHSGDFRDQDWHSECEANPA